MLPAMVANHPFPTRTKRPLWGEIEIIGVEIYRQHLLNGEGTFPVARVRAGSKLRKGCSQRGRYRRTVMSGDTKAGKHEPERQMRGRVPCPDC
jgi:hypothetical protein